MIQKFALLSLTVILLFQLSCTEPPSPTAENPKLTPEAPIPHDFALQQIRFHTHGLGPMATSTQEVDPKPIQEELEELTKEKADIKVTKATKMLAKSELPGMPSPKPAIILDISFTPKEDLYLKAKDYTALTQEFPLGELSNTKNPKEWEVYEKTLTNNPKPIVLPYLKKGKTFHTTLVYYPDNKSFESINLRSPHPLLLSETETSVGDLPRANSRETKTRAQEIANKKAQIRERYKALQEKAHKDTIYPGYTYTIQDQEGKETTLKIIKRINEGQNLESSSINFSEVFLTEITEDGKTQTTVTQVFYFPERDLTQYRGAFQRLVINPPKGTTVSLKKEE